MGSPFGVQAMLVLEAGADAAVVKSREDWLLELHWPLRVQFRTRAWGMVPLTGRGNLPTLIKLT